MGRASAARTIHFAALVALAALALADGSARASNAAEDFVRDNIPRGAAILNDKTLSPADKRAQLEILLNSVTDMRRTALYTLGPAAKTTSTEQLEAFVTAFRGYDVALYLHALRNYDGESLKVEGSVEHGPGDTIVQSFILDPNGRRWVNAKEVDFRVMDSDGKPVIVDLAVIGVWYSFTLKEEFAGFLSQRGNDLARLTKWLINRTGKLKKN